MTILNAAHIARLCEFMYGSSKGREVDSVIKDLYERDLLVARTNDGPTYYIISGRGKAYVAMLEATPLPEMQWCDPRKIGDAT